MQLNQKDRPMAVSPKPDESARLLRLSAHPRPVGLFRLKSRDKLNQCKNARSYASRPLMT